MSRIDLLTGELPGDPVRDQPLRVEGEGVMLVVDDDAVLRALAHHQVVGCARILRHVQARVESRQQEEKGYKRNPMFHDD